MTGTPRIMTDKHVELLQRIDRLILLDDSASLMAEVLAFVQQSVSSGDCVSACAACGAATVDIVRERNGISWGGARKGAVPRLVTVDDEYSRCTVCGEEFYTSAQSRNHTRRVRGAVIASLEFENRALLAGDCVSVPRSEIGAVMLKLRKRANFADTIGDQNFLEGLRDELAGWLGEKP